MRALLEQKYTVPPAPKCLNRNAFLLDELSYQDIQQQLTLLMVAYTRDLQYWAEKPNLPSKKSRLLPFGRKCCGAKGNSERTCRLQPLGCCPRFRGNPSNIHKLVAPNNLFSCMLSPMVDGQDFMETTTHTASPIAEEDMTRCTTPPSGTERENWYQLVITASVGQLNFGPSGNNHKRSTADPHDENTFWNPWMAATYSGSTRVISYGGTTMKELNE